MKRFSQIDLIITVIIFLIVIINTLMSNDAITLE